MCAEVLQNAGLQLITLDARLTKLPAAKLWGGAEQPAQNRAQMAVPVANFAKHEWNFS